MKRFTKYLIAAGLCISAISLPAAADDRDHSKYDRGYSGGRGHSQYERGYSGGRGHSQYDRDYSGGRGHSKYERGFPSGRSHIEYRHAPRKHVYHTHGPHCYSTGRYIYEHRSVFVPGYWAERYVPPTYRTQWHHGRQITVQVSGGYYEKYWIPGRHELKPVKVWVPGRIICRR